MKKLIVTITLTVQMTSGFSACAPLEKGDGLPTESWQLDGYWQDSLQAIWDDIMVGIETVRQEGQTTRYYISTYDLRSREKERVLELPAERIIYDAPAIHGDRVVWASVDRDEAEQQRSLRKSPMPNWDVFLLDLETGEVRQLTTNDRAQVHPGIYGDTVVWLDARYEEGYHNPRRYDVFAYDLRSNEESRITSTTSAEDRDLSINGNLIVWTDNRHADPEVTIHAGNEPDYNNEIYLYDLAAGEERRITNYAGNDHYPAIDGSRIVWLRQLGYLEADIYTYDLNTRQEDRISQSGYAAGPPGIHGDRIVWADARLTRGNTSGDSFGVDESAGVAESGSAEIYLYDLGTKREVLLVPSEGTEFTEMLGQKEIKSTAWQVWMRPIIYGDFVVYTLERQIGSIIHAMRLTEK